jgi:hypothetical protein
MKTLAEAILATAHQGNDVREAQQTLRTCSTVFGLRLDAQVPETHVLEGWNRIMQAIA